MAASQHGVVTRRQLLEANLTSDEIDGRIAKGRLHRVWRGVYAVGRPGLTERGCWMAAVLACGNDALLSHESAGALWGIHGRTPGSEAERRRPPLIHVSVPGQRTHRRAGLRAHRRIGLSAADGTLRDGIPVTSPARTLVDLATFLSPGRLEAAVNQADKLDLIDPDELREAVEPRSGERGAGTLRRILDSRTFALTDSELERLFLRIVHRAGLPPPLTQQRVNGFRVDFYWPQLDLVVETDGLRYHRTATQQARDRVRDQKHVAAGLTPLRFTHAQVKFESGEVVETLRAVLESRSIFRL